MIPLETKYCSSAKHKSQTLWQPLSTTEEKALHDSLAPFIFMCIHIRLTPLKDDFAFLPSTRDSTSLLRALSCCIEGVFGLGIDEVFALLRTKKIVLGLSEDEFTQLRA